MEEAPLLSEAVIAHFGVKGMKWGVRKTYNQRQGARVARLDRVASGTGSRGDKIRALAETSAAELVVNKGLKNTARKHSDATKAHLIRINTGKAKTLDLVQMYGSMSVGDLINAGRDKNRQAPA